MIFLSETKMRDHRIDGVRRRMGMMNGFNVSPIGRAGGLSLWWDVSVDVIITSSSRHFIDAIMRVKGDQHWIRFTGVYGTPYSAEKEDFWLWMSSVFTPSDIPWICGGDFNEFIWSHEKSGGAAMLHNRQIFLQKFMEDAMLLDLGFKGPSFTWRGLRNGNWVEERVDRALINGLWQER